VAHRAKGRAHGGALRLGRVSRPGAIYFVTSGVRDKQPLIVPEARGVVIESVNWLARQGRICRLGYVVLDDHFHLMLRLRDAQTLSGVMDSLKTFTSKQISRLIDGGGPFWQEGYHDHLVRDKNDFWVHLSYMHLNPVRRGWVAEACDYEWSTAHPKRSDEIDWAVLRELHWVS
jgi:REP-associated tyrosine transposase